jgi:hypothetical protein
MEAVTGIVSSLFLISMNVLLCVVGGRRFRFLEERIRILEERPVQLPTYATPQYTYAYPQATAPSYQDPQVISRV